jgi:hypothetical protein
MNSETAGLYETCSSHNHEKGHSSGRILKIFQEVTPVTELDKSLEKFALAESTSSQPLPLSLEYSRAELLFRHIERGDTCDEDHDPIRHAKDALQAFLRCSDLARQEGVLPSKDENIDDILTENLRYILIEYYIAILRSQRCAPPMGPLRSKFLKDASLGLEVFANRAIAIGAASKNDAGALYNDENEEDHTSSRSLSYSSSSREFSRASKIERYKRQQEAKKKLLELQKIHDAEAAARIHRRLKNDGTQGDELEIPDGVGASKALGVPDEKTLREMTLLNITIAVRTAADEAQSIASELLLLAHGDELARKRAEATAEGAFEGASSALRAGAPSSAEMASTQTNNFLDRRMRGGQYTNQNGGRRQGQGDDSNRSNEGEYQDGPPPWDLSISESRPGIEVQHIDPTFKVTKETIKANIFKHGHNLPTQSLDEWGEEVMEIARAREERHAEQGKTRVKTLDELHELGFEDDNELHDKATLRMRGFEDWKDGVPRGSGNIIGRNK